MTRQSTKHSGGRTLPAQQRINRAKSLSTLSDLLHLNFSTGDCLIVLGYRSGQYIPTGEYAEADIVDWVRRSKRQLAYGLKYVRATEQDRNGERTVHRIIVGAPKKSAVVLAAYWEYGPAQVEEIQAGQLPALAERLIKNTETVPNHKTWAASRGLKRS